MLIEKKIVFPNDIAYQMESLNLRKFFNEKYSINVGLYSYGCFDSGRIAKQTTIGRYCSFSKTANIFGRNHPIDYFSQHPFFYNEELGFSNRAKIKDSSLLIEDDVWLGHNSIICPSVDFIGRGAIIGAGAVVTKNIERYEIVAGNPAKKIKNRFDKDYIGFLEESKWWLMNIKELDEFSKKI